MKKTNVRCHNLTRETMTDEMMAAVIRTLLSPAKLECTQCDPNIFVYDQVHMYTVV